MSKVNAAFSPLFWTQRQIVKLCIKLRIEPGVADGWLSNVCLWLWIRNNQNFVFFKVCVKTFSGYLLLESRYASAKFLTEHEAGNTTEMRESGEAEIQTQTMFSRLGPRWSVLKLWPGMMHFLATITRKGTYLLLHRIEWFILSSISYAIPGYSITAIHALKANYRLFRFLDLNTGGENAEMIWRYEARQSLLTCDK